MRGLIVSVCLVALFPVRIEANATARFLEILSSLHPDYGIFVGEVRDGGRRLHPSGLLSGLVRPGGENPRDPRDAPRAGGRNDIIVYDDTFEAGTSTAWHRLLVDHEYFHARHLGRGAEAPAVDFGDEGANRHYYEALAWGYNLERIEQGRYPGLSPREARRSRERYWRHRAGFESWLLRYHADAWSHYGRFFEHAGEREDS